MKTFSVHIDQNRKPDSITSSKLILATKTSLREILASPECRAGGSFDHHAVRLGSRNGS